MLFRSGGKFIDGHQSRQDAGALRQLAGRLQGMYHDGNARHLPSADLAALSKVMPMRDAAGMGRRQAALVASGLGGGLLAGLPVVLALAGAPGQGRDTTRRRGPNAGLARDHAGAFSRNTASPENP